MAQSAQHFEQARGNRAHAEHLLATYPHEPIALQWAVTTAFYAALHYMTGYLIQHGVQVSNPQQREAAIADPRNGVPLHVYDAYVRLKRRSTSARYLLQTFTPVQVRTQILDTHLATVTTFVQV